MSYSHRVECERLQHALRAAVKRAEAAEAKLAELENQEHYVEVMKDGPMTVCHWMKPASELPDGAKLFTRPAPAVDLAELVPDEATDSQFDGLSISKAKGWNACRAAILRNIEEASSDYLRT